jgi:hypothetical protein
MSYHEANEPECTARRGDVALVIRPRERDLGGFSVRRVLPAAARQTVGPFIFFDHMGPAQFPPGQGIDVRPHPHIGLSTVTYLFQGRIRHRDSLGFVQDIEPGAVNLMVAGSGIVHSERSPDKERADGSRLPGIQMWMALPTGQEDCDPAFRHHAAGSLPVVELPGANIQLIIGSLCQARSPVVVPTETLCCEIQLRAGAVIDVPLGPQEAALYVVEGCVTLGGCDLHPHTMAVLAPGSGFRLEASEAARCFLIGGAPVGARHIWWNFVAGDMGRIELAKQRWRSGQFPRVPGEQEFIPLPE